MTRVNQSIFREYDVRGVVGEDLTEDFAYLLGRAHGTMLRRAGAGNAVVGYDVRPSSPSLAGAVIDGFVKSGLDVIAIGEVPTPVFYWAVVTMDAGGGMTVTGSHNPPEFNGFKINLGHSSIYGEQIQELYRLITNDDFESGSGRVEEKSVLEDYIADLSGRVGRVARPIKAIADCGNGCAAFTVDILKNIGADVECLYCEPDGTFPNHHPDPTRPGTLKDLIAKVKETGAEVGLGFDGDADRLGVVDTEGNMIWGDRLLVLYSREVLKKRPGAEIIFEVKCSQALVEEIEKAGGKPEMYRTGHSLIKERMRELNAPLAGEMSGHLFFADEFYGFDDAVYAAARLLRILAASDKTITEHLADVPVYYSTPEIRVDCPDDEKFAVVDRLTEYFKAHYKVVDIDGARVLFGDGWGLVRASNTQPVLVLRFEARTKGRLEEIKRVMLEKLAELSSVDVSGV